MLFAGEHEAETFEFLRSLPAQRKAGVCEQDRPALLGVVSLLGLMWLLAAWLKRLESPDARENHRWRATFWASSGWRCFCGQRFFSLLLKRVLMAAILGVAAASVGAFLLAVSVSNTPAIAMGTTWRQSPGAVLAALLALADIWLAARWFRPRVGRPVRAAPPAVDAALPTAAAFSDRFRAPRGETILGRLLWQHWRQTRWLTATILGTMIVPLMLVVFRWWLHYSQSHAGTIPTVLFLCLHRYYR